MDSPEAPPRESVTRTLVVALLVCGACAALISASVVVLRPIQQANQERDRRARVLEMVRATPGLAELVRDVEAEGLEARLVELATGDFAASRPDAVWDVQQLAGDPERCTPIPLERDDAEIECVPFELPVHLVYEGEKLRLVILPVYGYGYVSTMWGYLALDGDLDTVRSLQFWEHEETPGLGAEIDTASWRRQWQGKRLRDETGALRIRVSRDRVDPASPDFAYSVDGISGATRTGTAVTRIVRFWLGPDGYGPLLERLGLAGGGPS